MAAKEIRVDKKAKKVLLIEDDRMVSMLLQSSLEKAGYQVDLCFRGDLAVKALNKTQPDLVLLDLILPGLSGFQVCQQLREIYSGPLIVVTARNKEAEQISALNLGADDYLIKPVSPNLLKARIIALLRRQPIQDNQSVPHIHRVGDIELNPLANKCYVNQKEIKLSVFELKLMAMLLRNHGRVLTRELIYQTLLGREYNGVERTVDVRISRLREKLVAKGLQKLLIETVWGKGYILNEK